MNESGKGVRKAWEQFLRGLGGEEGGRAVLCVVHDELELPLGKVKVKAGRGSARYVLSCLLVRKGL
jgi:peptidyl-tRNA hydrolase